MGQTDVGASQSRMFASLSVPNYRKFFFGALITNVGSWMQSTAQGWLVLTVLTNESLFHLGLVTALQTLFIPILAPWAGAIADRVPKRRILMATVSLTGLNALALAIMVDTQHVTLAIVYWLALIQGIVSGFDMPARQAMVSEIVADKMLPNAVGLNGTSFNSARLIGPGVAGLVMGAFGITPVLYLNAAAAGGMLWAMATMKSDQLHPAPARRGGGSTIEGLRYIKSRKDILLIMIIVFMVATFSMNFQIVNAAMAASVFHRGAQQYGLLGTLLAIGTLAGALMAARSERPRLRTIMVGLFGLAAFSMALAMSPHYVAYGILLMPVGYCMLAITNTANSTVQLSTPAVLRGRVMAVYMAVLNGGAPIGASFIGWIGDALSPEWAIFMGAAIAGVTGIGALIYLWRGRGLRASLAVWPPRVTVWSVQPQVGS